MWRSIGSDTEAMEVTGVGVVLRVYHSGSVAMQFVPGARLKRLRMSGFPEVVREDRPAPMSQGFTPPPTEPEFDEEDGYEDPFGAKGPSKA